MSSAELKNSIFRLIDAIDDEQSLRIIYNALVEEKKDWFNNLTPEEVASVRRGLSQINNRNTIPHTEVDNELNELIEKHA